MLCFMLYIINSVSAREPDKYCVLQSNYAAALLDSVQTKDMVRINTLLTIIEIRPSFGITASNVFDTIRNTNAPRNNNEYLHLRNRIKWTTYLNCITSYGIGSL